MRIAVKDIFPSFKALQAAWFSHKHVLNKRYGTLEATPLERNRAWPDLAFGLDLNQMCLDQPLAQAFQLSVFTTPVSSLYNLGMKSPSITMSDLWTVFEFIGFVKAYSDKESSVDW
jgi:hypothetical protein